MGLSSCPRVVLQSLLIIAYEFEHKNEGALNSNNYSFTFVLFLYLSNYAYSKILLINSAHCYISEFEYLYTSRNG